MRWLFYDPLNAEEAARRAAAIRSMDRWWAAFVERADDLHDLFNGKRQWDLVSWMSDRLHSVDERLMWEFGQARSGKGHRLVITPEQEHWLRPQVHTLLDRAPELSGWEFYPWRQRETIEAAQTMVQGRAGGDLSAMTVEAALSSLGKVDLLFRSPNCTEQGESDMRQTALVAAECLLGEQTLAHWIGGVDVAPSPKDGLISTLLKSSKEKASRQRRLPLDRLAPTVDALAAHVMEQLPERPCFEAIDDFTWSTFKMAPEKRADYPDRSDMLVAIASRADVIKTAHSGGLFHSECLSRCGERFCYIKIDGEEGLEGSDFKDRADIEDRLNEALRGDGLGCVIGGGTGLRYSYVDLALVDVQAGVQAARRVLLKGRAPRRSWFLFFDEPWKREWIGVHPDAPTPLLE